MMNTYLDETSITKLTHQDHRVVECMNLARTFGHGRASVVALQHATCTINHGHRVALVGASGSGKSTLLHLLAGLDAPTAGTISWPALNGAALRPGPVAVVFQAPSLLPPLNVVENVALPLLLAGVNDSDATAQANVALAMLKLDGLARKLPDELSGGQAQRVAVARALVGSPHILLADEPTGQLDHASAHVVIDALLAVADHCGAALVIATHDNEIAQRFTQRWSVADGRLTTQEYSK